MENRFRKIIALCVVVLATTGCTPLLVAGGVVVADSVVEDREGGDGLF